MRWSRFLTAALLLSGLGANCIPEPQPKSRSSAALRGFSSPDELRDYLAQQVEASMSPTRSDGGGGLFDFLIAPVALSGAAPQAAGEATANDSGGSATSDPFSTTNIQEEGVDESDIVKNNGQTIFAIDGNKIHIVNAIPPGELAEIATIDLPFSGDSLYLQGQTLVAISRQYGYYYYAGGGDIPEPAILRTADGNTSVSSQSGSSSGSTGTATSVAATADTAILPFDGRAQTVVGIYDVTDPANPALKNTVTFEGTLADSRLIETRLHLVLATTPVLPANPTPETLRAQELPAWIPDYQVTNPDGSVASSGDVVGWEHVFRPDYPDGYGIITVVTLDIEQPAAPFASTSITADAGVVYASRDALYVTDTNYDYTSGTYRVDTAIHKLAFTEGGTEYRASGLIPGRLLNQYSLGEHADYLRVASHVDASTESQTEGNGVYVLGENAANASLDVVGKVENIAPGEQIYAARFVGDRGYLVTFLRIDPLFVLDLSDPANPVVAGELKVPGFSDHLQLLDENHLLAIGKDAQDAGSFAWMQGVAISLFDVTDPANPTRLDHEIIGTRGSSSEANYNPKAFNYFAARDALAFPVDVYEGAVNGPEIGSHNFTGLYVYRVTVAGGFEFLGRISSGGGTSGRGCFLGYYGYTRGLFIGDNVYSVTQRGVKAAALADVATLLGETTYPGAASLYEDCYYYGPNLIFPVGDGIR